MGAGGDEYQEFRIERARIVPGVLGLLGLLGLRVLEVSFERTQRRQHFRRTPDNVNRLLAPKEVAQHLARLDLRQIDNCGQTGGACALGRIPRRQEGHRGQDRTYRTRTDRGGYQKFAPTLVDFGDGIVGRVIAHS
jgi:hypothetical protein